MKFNQSENNDELKVGSVQETYKQSNTDKTKKVEKSISGEVEMIFKQNRTFDLHIGRIVYRFEGRQKKRLPKSILNHPDWTNQIARLFVVKEI